MPRSINAVTFLLSLTMFAGGASASIPATTLVVADNISDIICLDPAEAYEAGGGEVISNVYDRLIRYEANDLTHLGHVDIVSSQAG